MIRFIFNYNSICIVECHGGSSDVDVRKTGSIDKKNIKQNLGLVGRKNSKKGRVIYWVKWEEYKRGLQGMERRMRRPDTVT